jgi:hypothetical protein
VNLVAYYLAALLLTIDLELPVAALTGLRKAKELLAVALVSVFTHPILSLALVLLPSDLSRWALLTCILLLELAVVLAEWKLLVYALRREDRMLATTVAMNVVSFLGGTVLFW